MTGTQTLLARAALGAAAALASVVLTASSRLAALPGRTFDRLVNGAMLVSRFGLFGLIFLVLHLAPRGDIQGYYLPQALEVMHHHLPYRDFPSSYAPLHPYLDAIFARLSPTPLSIMFFAVVAELLVIPLWLKLGRCLLPERDLRLAALLYLASPISLQFVTVDGQDNVVIAVLIALALLLLQRNRPLLSGVTFATAAATIKFLPLLYGPAFFAALSRRWRWLAGTIALLAAVYGGALLLHLPILQPLSAEGNMRSAGNLPFVLEVLGGFSIPGRVSDLLLLTVFAAIFLVVGRASLHAAPKGRTRALTFGIAALTIALVLFAKKCWPPYLMLSLFPIGLLVGEAGRRSRLRLLLFAVFAWVAVTEHSVWANFQDGTSAAMHLRLFAGDPHVLLFFALQLLLLTGYAWLLVEAVQRVLRASDLASAQSEIPA